jgi:hypothetical protein
MLITLPFNAQLDKNHDDYAADAFADARPTFVVCGQNQSAVEESLVEIGESKPCLSRLARRFGSSHTIFTGYIVVTICSDVHSNGATILRGLAACFALCAFPP